MKGNPCGHHARKPLAGPEEQWRRRYFSLRRTSKPAFCDGASCRLFASAEGRQAPTADAARRAFHNLTVTGRRFRFIMLEEPLSHGPRPAARRHERCQDIDLYEVNEARLDPRWPWLKHYRGPDPEKAEREWRGYLPSRHPAAAPPAPKA